MVHKDGYPEYIKCQTAINGESCKEQAEFFVSDMRGQLWVCPECKMKWEDKHPDLKVKSLEQLREDYRKAVQRSNR